MITLAFALGIIAGACIAALWYRRARVVGFDRMDLGVVGRAGVYVVALKLDNLAYPLHPTEAERLRGALARALSEIEANEVKRLEELVEAQLADEHNG